MSDVIVVKNLTKKFGSGQNEFTAVNNVSFSLKEGEIVGLLGPNGAGKRRFKKMFEEARDKGYLTKLF